MNRLIIRWPNESLDASGRSAFLNLLGAAVCALIRAAASTQPLGRRNESTVKGKEILLHPQQRSNKRVERSRESEFDLLRVVTLRGPLTRSVILLFESLGWL